MLPAAIKPGARVNVYAEEMTDRIEIIGKEIDEEYYRRVAARKKK